MSGAEQRARPRRRWILLLIYLAFLFLLVEVCSRAFLTLTMGASPLRPSTGIHRFYPEVAEALAEKGEGERPLRVLFLGGSVLAPGERDIRSVLQQELGQRAGRPVQVVNVARHAHMTPDSLRKYRMMTDQRFDLVIYYHAINDVRANICPDDVYRDDYSHMLWHRNINRFTAHGELDLLAFPYVGHLLWDTVADRVSPPDLVPMKTAEGEVTPEGDNFAPWLVHGAKIKTGPAFARNVEAVVQLARQRKEPLLLLTFATYLAPGYTVDRFEQKRLDYAKHDVPTEVWGRPAHVTRGVAAHNKLLRGIARASSGVRFVDIAAAIKDGKASYDDICHLTLAGRKAWVSAVLPAALEALGAGRAP